MHGPAEVQTSFERALRGGVLPPGLTARDPAETQRRFNVYRNTVVVSLTDALAARFPVIRRLVGKDFFGQVARLYLERERPKTPVLSLWGQGFAAFLEGFAPLRAYRYMADVARIEFQRGISFHAADSRPADPGLFVNVDPASLRVGLDPSVAVLHLNHAGVSIWAANQPGRQPGPITHRAEIALIYRDRAFDVPVRSLSAADAGMISALMLGAPLLEAARRALVEDATHDAGRLLRELMAAGLITQAGGRECAS